MNNAGLQSIGACQPDDLAKTLGSLFLRLWQTVEYGLAEYRQDRGDALGQAESWQQLLSLQVGHGETNGLPDVLNVGYLARRDDGLQKKRSNVRSKQSCTNRVANQM